jgi:hypothetical protein
MARSIKDLKLWDNSILARKWNQLVDEVERRTVSVGAGLQLTETGSATIVSVLKKRSGGTAGAAVDVDTCPFDITLTPQASPSTHYDVTLLAGTVNGMVPSGMMSAFDYDPATTAYVKINCGTNGKTVSSATMVVDTSAPTYIQANASGGQSTFDITIAVIKAPGTVMKTLGWCGSVQVTLQEVFLADKVSPAIGEAPYTRWYQWILAAA